MWIKSKIKIENAGMFTAFAFYTIVGIICFAVLPLANFPPHIGIIGVLNLITAYGLFKKRVWSIWIVAMLFFIATTFSASTLYFGRDFLLDASAITYLILTWIFTAYVAAKRRKLES